MLERKIRFKNNLYNLVKVVDVNKKESLLEVKEMTSLENVIGQLRVNIFRDLEENNF